MRAVRCERRGTREPDHCIMYQSAPVDILPARQVLDVVDHVHEASCVQNFSDTCAVAACMRMAMQKKQP